MLRYVAGSAVATVCSEATFLLLYGPVDTSPAAASVVAWFAGAVPNYWLNRTWTWQRQGRPSLRGELIPYIAIILGTLLLAVLATTAADHLLSTTSTSPNLQVLLVGAVFLGVYGLVFLVRFALLDRLFHRLGEADAAETSGKARGRP